MIDDGLVYHEHKDTDEVRIYIGAITTINSDQSELPQVEFGGKGKLIIMNDNPDGEKTCVNIEGIDYISQSIYMGLHIGVIRGMFSWYVFTL